MSPMARSRRPVRLSGQAALIFTRCSTSSGGGLTSAAGLSAGLHLLDQLLEAVAGEPGDAVLHMHPCSARADTTVPEIRRSMVDGAIHVPLLPPGWVHSHSTNITSLPGVTASTSTPEAAQNFAQLAQSWA